MEGLGLGRGARVLAVVGELRGVAGRGNGVGVDDGSTTTGNEGPDAALGVEDGQLERSGIVGLLLGQLAAERSWELHWWPGIDGDL